MEENLSPQESLVLIQSMIEKTKANISDNRIYFLFWGWLSFIAIITQFFLKVVLHSNYHYLVWIFTIPATILTILYTIKRNKTRLSRTYVGDSMGYLWTGVGVSFFILSFIVSLSAAGWNFSYPFFIMLYGLGTFVSGKIIQFKPLVVGGVINWILACASVYFPFDYQLLFAAGALLTSYIIPGHLLGRRKNK